MPTNEKEPSHFIGGWLGSIEEGRSSNYQVMFWWQHEEGGEFIQIDTIYGGPFYFHILVYDRETSPFRDFRNEEPPTNEQLGRLLLGEGGFPPLAPGHTGFKGDDPVPSDEEVQFRTGYTDDEEESFHSAGQGSGGQAVKIEEEDDVMSLE